jgi:hypothetical protein
MLRYRKGRREWLGTLVLSGKPFAASVVSMTEVHAGLRHGEEA